MNNEVRVTGISGLYSINCIAKGTFFLFFKKLFTLLEVLNKNSNASNVA